MIVLFINFFLRYFFRVETIRSALDVIAICAVYPAGMAELCKDVPLPENEERPAISIILAFAEGEYVPDPDVQKAALGILFIIVCAPLTTVIVV